MINAPAKVDAFRFYWNAPIEISAHNPAKIYMAAQYFFKSNNRGDTWWMNPTDLSKNVNRWAPGAGHHGRFRRKAHGIQARWLCRQFPGYADSRVSFASRRDLDRHRRRQSAGQPGRRRNVYQRDRQHQAGAPGSARLGADLAHRAFPLRSRHLLRGARQPSKRRLAARTCYKTTDYGKTWTNITGNLPAKGNINALREDYDNPNLLFVGTEFGLYVTLARRQGMEQVHDRAAQRARGRYPDSPARP